MQYIKKNNAIIDILKSGRNGPVIRNPGNNINNIFGKPTKNKLLLNRSIVDFFKFIIKLL